jgi:RNA polymerase sigma-70 factor (ECF subfamily)
VGAGAALTRRFGDLDITEATAAEAFAAAVEQWPTDGVATQTLV